MSEMKLSKKIKEIIVPGCAFKIIEEEDGIIIELIPSREKVKGTTCAPVIDPGGNLIHCRAIDCGAGCRICTQEYPDGYYEYYCKCGKCPPKEN